MSTRALAQDSLVEAVVIEGNRVVPEETYLFHIRCAVGERYDRDLAIEDFHRLWETGFLDDLTLDVSDGERGKVLTFVVTERPRVQRVEFRGSKQLDDSAIREKLREQNAEIVPESFYDPRRIVKAERAIRELLLDKGLSDGAVESNLEPIDATNVAVVFDIRDEQRVRIHSVQFDAAEAFEQWRLRSAMKGRHNPWAAIGVEIPSLLGKPLLGGGSSYSEEHLSEDLENVRELYLNNGYVGVSFGQPEITYEDGTRRFLFVWKRPQRWAHVTIPVSEGKRYRIGEVAVEGATVFRHEAVKNILHLEPGEVYDESKVTKGIEKLRELYGSVGYVQFTGFPIKRPVPDRDIVDVTVHLEEDKQYFVNRIEFRGNTITRDKVIRRELWLNEQDVLNMELLRASILRINQLGYFQPIEQPEITPVEGEENKLDITLRVTEQNRNQVSFGGGFSGLSGTFLNASFSTTNFLGRGETITVSGQLGARDDSFRLAFTQPYFRDKPVSAGIDLYKQQITFLSGQNLVGYTQSVSGLGFTFGFPTSRFSRLFTNYNYQIIDIFEVSADALLRSGASDPFTSSTTSIYSIAPPEVGRRHESALTPSWVRNTVNNPITPRSGTRYSASLQFVGGPLQGTVNYYRPTLEGVVYRPFGTKSAVGVRAQYGYIQVFGSTNEIPYYERYFLGGENQIRGYDIRTVAPYIPTSGTLVGGDEFVLFNAEYYFDIASPLRLVLFYDAGEAYLEGQNVNLRTLRTSTGAEARFLVPILNVPFRLIFAYNANRDYFQPATAFKFAIGTAF